MYGSKLHPSISIFTVRGAFLSKHSFSPIADLNGRSTDTVRVGCILSYTRLILVSKL